MKQHRNGQLNQTELSQKKKFKWLKKHMNKCSPSLAIKAMQIKTTLGFHLTPVRIAIIQNTTNNRYWQECGEKRNPCTLLVGMQAGATALENSTEAS
jgi:hypothetical protein